MKRLQKLISIIFIFLMIFNVSSAETYAEVTWPEPPTIKAHAAIVIDADTGAVIYEKNADETMYPASITKVVTAICAIENASLTDTVTFSENSIYSLPYDAARIGIVPNEEVNLLDCLYVLILRSANEVANGLAEHVSGSNEDFAVLMNEYATKAGATNTHFANPSGLHNDDHYTTARDFAKITRSAIRNDILSAVWSEDAYRMPATNKNSDSYSIWHRHNMIVSTRDAYYEKAIGGKTGYTGEAGNTLVTYAKDGDLSLISVVLKSDVDNVYKDTRKLLEYGFTNFQKTTVTDSTYGSLLTSNSFFSSYYGIFANNNNLVELISSDIIIAKNTTLSDYEKTVVYNETITNGIIANINFTHDGLYLGSVPVKLTTNKDDGISIGPSSPVIDDPPADTSNKRQVINVKYIIAVLVILIAIILLIIIITKIIKKRRRRRYNYTMSRRRLRKRYKYR